MKVSCIRKQYLQSEIFYTFSQKSVRRICFGKVTRGDFFPWNNDPGGNFLPVFHGNLRGIHEKTLLVICYPS